MSATSRQLQQFLAQLEPSIARAFREAVAGIRDRAQIAALESAITAGDFEGALRAAGVREAQWQTLLESVRSAYFEGGAFAAAADVPRRYGFQFNGSAPRATQWIAERSMTLAVELNQGQREAVRIMLSAGVEQGRNPRSIALDIVGRIGSNGRRTGGVVGLHSQFAQYAANARRDLEKLSPEYFTRSRRDRRFDALVRRAMDDGKPLSSETIDRLVTRYQDRLLQTRGTNVARSEALSAMNASADESLRQVVDEGLAPGTAIQRIWDATGDSRTRASHWDANGQRVGLSEPFIVGGARLMHPGDPNGPAQETINCRCIVRYVVDFARVV